MQIQLEGKLDMDRCGELAKKLAGQLKVGDHLTLDLANVQTADSAALALILELQRACRTQSASLHLQGLPAGLQALAALYGIESLIQPSTENS
ncbi:MULTISPECIES: lipid asymmetry maintenance protein MlaB [unclassified Paludibacterium]|uniref:STAS domain-containing protein n=1 Tax=unclassified Paludibacterium TaxID=2618429 RepID=UPI001C041973|nr:STAS domain-containing protein [Paludibacterium sp. B53371]BEV72827.1 hypothetical protein THUN1379_23090 [Paludibacterium sp. THUN1379]